jgi:hypothetical protein
VIEIIEKQNIKSGNNADNVTRFVLENTGIVIAHSIDHIIRRLEKTIGFPLRSKTDGMI